VSAPGRWELESEVEKLLEKWLEDGDRTRSLARLTASLADLLRPEPVSPAPERRPTRAEVEQQVANTACLTNTERNDLVDLIQRLFGPLPPEPVRVPTLGEFSGPSGCRVLPRGKGEQMTVLVAQAIAARSNAWEEVKERLRRALSALEGECSATSLAVASALRANLALMTAPQMGVGPEQEGPK